MKFHIHAYKTLKSPFMSFSFQQPFGQYKGTRNATMIQHMTTHTHHNLHLLQYLNHSHITMTSTTIFKCISHQGEIQTKAWQSHSSSNVPNNVIKSLKLFIKSVAQTK